MSLEDTLELITQRTGANVNLDDGPSKARFLAALRGDISSIVNQLNVVYNPLVSALIATDQDPLDTGLAGNVVVTDVSATSGSASVFYDTSLNRPRTIRESFDVILSTLATLTSSITVTATEAVDVSSQIADLLAQLVQTNLDLQQLKDDTQSTAYALNQDGNAVLDFPLSQHIDVLGSFFQGYPGTGNVYSGTYPDIALQVLLSQVLIDTTLAQSTVTDLETHLAAIRTFVGMDAVGSSPLYTAHGTVNYVSNGDSLELAIQELDEAVASISAASPFATAANVTSNSPGVLASDDFVFGSDSLDDDGNANHDARLLLDKSAGAFRAGVVNGTQWDTRGASSVAFGLNTQAPASYSTVTGSTNAVDSGSTASAIVGGTGHTIATSPQAIILGGTTNITTNADLSATVGGQNHGLGSGGFAADGSVILGGDGHTIGSAVTSTTSAIVGGTESIINAVSSAILGGTEQTISAGSFNTIVGGDTNTISGAGGDGKVVLGGDTNTISSTGDFSVIVGGATNTISGTASRAVILGGNDNQVVSASNAVAMGKNAYATHAGEVVIGGGIFPGDTTDFAGQAQAMEFIVIGSYPGSGTDPIICTLDGAAPSATNVFVIPEYTLWNVQADYVLFLTDGVEPIVTGTNGTMGTSTGFAMRLTDTTAFVSGDDTGLFEFSADNGVTVDTDQASTSPFAGYAPLTVGGAMGQFVSDAATDGAVVFQIRTNAAIDALGLNGRAVARVKIVQVRYDGS